MNGTSMRVAEGSRLEGLIESLWEGAGLSATLVAVNAEYVPRDAWHHLVLRDGSSIETIE